jgi:outer membrane protein assembly factor BamB
MTTAPEDGIKLYAVCVDRDTGKIVHDVVVFDVPKPAFCHPMNSYATPTPAIEKDRVYVHFGSAGTACIDTSTGKTIWARQDLPCDHFRGAASSPILYQNLLIVHFDGFDLQYVVAFDKQTGKTVWKQTRELDYTGVDGDNKKAYGTPAIVEVDGQPQLISPAALATQAFDPLTGRELWRVRHGGMNVSARPLFGHGLVYLNTGAGGDKMLAVKLGGHGDITPSHIAWKQGKSAPTRPSQLLIGDLFFMVNDDGIASCLEAETGKQVWQHRLEGTKYSASPIFADGRIYFFSEAGDVPVIEPSREFNVLAVNKLDSGFMASPAVAGKALFLRTRTHLYRIEK